MASEIKKLPNYKNILKFTSNVRNVWYLLKGPFCIYKPPGEHPMQSLFTLKLHICRDMNSNFVPRPMKKIVKIVGETNKEMKVLVKPNLADHLLVTGPRYITSDVRLKTANWLSPESSGLLVVGMGSWTGMMLEMRKTRPIKVYKVKGILGKSTVGFFLGGKVLERSTYDHVQRHHIDMICASMQSTHQKKMFEHCGVHMQSQEAYDLAVQGPLRTENDKVPMIYSIKCVDYQSPEFTLEIVCVNEDHQYLKELVHELGLQVRSNATCTVIQCMRFGAYSIEHALLKKHWDLEHITENMAMCKNILCENEDMIQPVTPVLKESESLQQFEASTLSKIESGELKIKRIPSA